MFCFVLLLGSGKMSTRKTVALFVPIVVVIIIILGLIAGRFSVLCWRKKSNQEIDFDQCECCSYALLFPNKPPEPKKKEQIITLADDEKLLISDMRVFFI